MARTFKVYKKDGTKVGEGASPVSITGLTPDTQYNAGDYTISAVEDGNESTKVDIPAFKTKVATVAVTGVTVNPTATTLKIGEGADITVAIAPDNATNKKFTVEGTNDAIATHTISEGKVRFTGVSAGEFTATIKTEDGAKTATVKVTVSPAE